MRLILYTPQSIESSAYDRLGSADDRLDRLRRLADLPTTRSTCLGRRSTRSTSSTWIVVSWPKFLTTVAFLYSSTYSSSNCQTLIELVSNISGIIMISRVPVVDL